MMTDKLITISMLLVLFLVSIVVSWCWGYLIGAGLTYMGIIQTPFIVAWTLAAISGLYFFLKLLSSRKVR